MLLVSILGVAFRMLPWRCINALCPRVCSWGHLSRQGRKFKLICVLCLLLMRRRRLPWWGNAVLAALLSGRGKKGAHSAEQGLHRIR